MSESLAWPNWLTPGGLTTLIPIGVRCGPSWVRFSHVAYQHRRSGPLLGIENGKRFSRHRDRGSRSGGLDRNHRHHCGRRYRVGDYAKSASSESDRQSDRGAGAVAAPGVQRVRWFGPYRSVPAEFRDQLELDLQALPSLPCRLRRICSRLPSLHSPVGTRSTRRASLEDCRACQRRTCRNGEIQDPTSAELRIRPSVVRIVCLVRPTTGPSGRDCGHRSKAREFGSPGLRLDSGSVAGQSSSVE